MRPKELRLVRVETSEQNAKFKEIVTKYHSYVQSLQTPGRVLNYLIMNGDTPIGCIGCGGLPMISLPIQQYLQPFYDNLPESERSKGGSKMWRMLNAFNRYAVNNWKFTLMPEAPENAGSRILSVFVILVRRDWKKMYGDNLRWMFTYIGAGKNGTIYRAAGWKLLGRTRGYTLKNRGYKIEGEKDRGVRIKSDKKLIFVKDLVPYPEGRVPLDIEGEAAVVQPEHPASSGEMSVKPTPAAPFNKSYRLILKDGRYVMERFAK